MKVSFHRASDGSLHESQAAFAKHETALKVKQAVDSAPLNYGVMEQDDRGNPNISIENIGKFVADNAEDLRRILLDNVVTVRGRKKSKKEEAASVFDADQSNADPGVVSDAVIVSETIIA
jgi:hypothetical protein